MKLKYNYLAIDQYGEKILLKDHPRKELMDYLGATHADKMYVDIEGKLNHIGYVIRRHWFDVFKLSPLNN